MLSGRIGCAKRIKRIKLILRFLELAATRVLMLNKNKKIGHADQSERVRRDDFVEE